MKTKSGKAKARVLQDEVRDHLRAIAKELNLGLEEDDIVGREMGQRGVDVRMSPMAVRLLGSLQIECKNCEKLNVVGAFREHVEKYQDQPGLKFLVHTRNADKESKGKKQPRVVLVDLNDFMTLLKENLRLKRVKAEFKHDFSQSTKVIPECSKCGLDQMQARDAECIF